MYNFCSEDDLIIIQLENKSWPQLSASIDSSINYSVYKCYKNSQSNTILCWSHQEASMKGMDSSQVSQDGWEIGPLSLICDFQMMRWIPFITHENQWLYFIVTSYLPIALYFSLTKI